MYTNTNKMMRQYKLSRDGKKQLTTIVINLQEQVHLMYPDTPHSVGDI